MQHLVNVSQTIIIKYMKKKRKKGSQDFITDSHRFLYFWQAAKCLFYLRNSFAFAFGFGVFLENIYDIDRHETLSFWLAWEHKYIHMKFIYMNKKAFHTHAPCNTQNIYKIDSVDSVVFLGCIQGSGS